VEALVPEGLVTMRSGARRWAPPRRAAELPETFVLRRPPGHARGLRSQNAGCDPASPKVTVGGPMTPPRSIASRKLGSAMNPSASA
jgi:hypothetical protein